MAAIARAFNRAFHPSDSNRVSIEAIIIFCGLGLLVSLCVASYGIDLSLGFF